MTTEALKALDYLIEMANQGLQHHSQRGSPERAAIAIRQALADLADMAEKETIENMLNLAQYLRDKLNRKDCKKAYEILGREIMTMQLRIERGI